VLKKAMYFESASGGAAGSSQVTTAYAMNPKGVRVKAKAPMKGNTDFAFRDSFELMPKLTEMEKDRFRWSFDPSARVLTLFQSAIACFATTDISSRIIRRCQLDAGCIRINPTP
jgi:hypothetical protein